jgi:2'-5' RNA ligase
MSLSMQQLRLFVAVELPDSWREALAEQQAALRSQLGGMAEGLRWVRPDGFHLTVLFLGERPAHEEPRIESVLQRATAGVTPFALSPGRLGSFGGRHPRVVQTSVEGEIEALEVMQRGVAQSYGAGGQHAERFLPHITLARVRQGRPHTAGLDAESLANAISGVSPVTAGAFTVHELSLMQSMLLAGGAQYRCRLRVALRNG